MTPSAIRLERETLRAIRAGRIISTAAETNARRADAHQRARILQDATARMVRYPDQTNVMLRQAITTNRARRTQEAIGNGQDA